MQNTTLAEVKNFAKGTEIGLKALACEIESAYSTADKPYIKGYLKDKDSKLAFKMWDITYDQLMTVASCNGVVYIEGKVDVYQNIPQIIVKMIVDCIDDDPSQYTVSSLYSGEDLKTGILKNIVDKYVKTEFIVGMMYSVLCEEWMTYYPYSNEAHTEKGGWANCMYRTLDAAAFHTLRGLEVKPDDGANAPDIEVIIAAIILSKLGTDKLYEVHSVTGEITSIDNITKLMLGNTVHTKRAEKVLINYEQALNNGEIEDNDVNYQKLFKIRHCVLALNGIVRPAIVEAVICNLSLKNETETHECYQTAKMISTGEISKVSLGNHSYTFVGQ